MGSVLESNSIHQVRDFVERAGYRAVPEVVLWGPRDIWYEKRACNDDVTQVILLEYKNKMNAYSFYSGVYSTIATQLLASSHHLISKYLHASLGSPENLVLKWPCWALFDLGRVLWKPLFCVPNPLNRAECQFQLVGVEEKILRPIFWPVHSAEGIVNLLRRIDCGLEWFACIPILRLAQLAATAKISGIERQEIVNYCQTLSAVPFSIPPGSPGAADLISEIYGNFS